ncbi:alpha/beta fold hydrolase [Phenylobacterium sp. LjRoot164]|uniref:esterase/lipase family protein n=1 Tax=unclassified Phenylobacterium TaxID=2640670 RepID=UPI003ECCD437
MRTFPALAIGLMLSTTAVPVVAEAAQCTRGWSGSVQYFRSQADSNSKTVERVSRKGVDTTTWSMTYEYAAQIAVRPAPEPDQSLGRANINLSSISTETTAANDQHICPGTRTPRAMSGAFVTKSQTRANGSGLEAGVNISMSSNGEYTVGVRLPEVKGTASGSTSSSYSGQCTPKQGVNQSIADMPTTINGLTFSSSGEDRVSPSDPDRLSGSHSVTSFGTTETLKWNLRRCGGALRLVEVKFEDMRFPTWEAWQEISEQKGTIDGNIVRVTATVANDGPDEKSATIKFRETYKGDKWDGDKPDSLIEELSVTVPAGEQAEVSFKWDSSGYAWYDDGRPRLVQRIRTELEDAGKKVDDKTQNLKVAPKPLVLVHGLWSNWRAWEVWQNILTTSHSYDWKAFPVGEKPEHGRMRTGDEVGNLGPTNTIAQNAVELGLYVKYAQQDRNAWHVDIVAHSMGGLISRRYIHATMPTYPDGKPQVSHLVMLGTPNMGSRCADMISAPMETAGESMDALRDLRPSVVAQFNAAHANRKGVEFSVLAGNPLPAICYMFDANDGVVTVPSATWTIADTEQQSVLHTSMTGVEGFSSFVKPRVAIGPKAAAQPVKLSALSALGQGLDASDGSAADVAVPDFSQIAKLAPGQTLKVVIPVRQARNLGVTFVAASQVSATLTDDKGAVAAENLAGKPEASQIFRSLYVERPITPGDWTLTLRNEDQVERKVVLSTWSSPS